MNKKVWNLLEKYRNSQLWPNNIAHYHYYSLYYLWRGMVHFNKAFRYKATDCYESIGWLLDTILLRIHTEDILSKIHDAKGTMHNINFANQ